MLFAGAAVAPVAPHRNPPGPKVRSPAFGAALSGIVVAVSVATSTMFSVVRFDVIT